MSYVVEKSMKKRSGNVNQLQYVDGGIRERRDGMGC